MQTRSYICVYETDKRRETVIVSSMDGKDTAIQIVKDSVFGTFKLISITVMPSDTVYFLESVPCK